jgi:AAA+ superfamily predicted ATPase
MSSEASIVSQSMAAGKATPVQNTALERVLARVRLRAMRRAAWLRKLWAEEGEPGGKLAVTHAEIDTHLADRDSPEAEAQFYTNDKSLTSINQELQEIESAIDADETSPLKTVEQIFGLSEEDIDILHACLAMSIDPSMARVYAYLQDNAGHSYVTDHFVSRLFEHGRNSVWNSESFLRRWELVREKEVAPNEPLLLEVDPFIRNWLEESHVLDPNLIGIANIHEPEEPLREWPVAETASYIERIVHRDPPGRVRIHIVGPPGSGRRTFAAAVCASFGLPLIVLDSDSVEQEQWRRVYLHAQRQAFLDRSALAWYGSAYLQWSWPKDLASFPIQFAILEQGQAPIPLPDTAEHQIKLTLPNMEERQALWRRYLPEVVSWPQEKFTELARRYRVMPGEIASVASSRPAGAEEAASLVRESARNRLGRLALRVECPFDWDDLVLPERVKLALEDLVFESEERVAFWELPQAQRLYPNGRGLLALFSGVPGTGKTMAAQVIASRLGLDLFRIDLSAVVSKYVGETSQNLERILSRAQHMDVVLLFDEFDALGGKRTEIKDAHDRFANTDTNYLLQAIEDYRGVAILSTNKKSNVDNAFIRRIRYVLEFPKPDASQRFTIWQRLVAELAGVEILHAKDNTGRALNETLKTIASTLELTGAQIKFAVLTAMFATCQEHEKLNITHLLRGIDRELLKEGRAISDRDRVKLVGSK